MMKILKVAGSLSLSLLILFSAFFYVMDLDAFYTYEIEKNSIEEVVKIPKEDLLPLYKVLTDYMIGAVESIQIDAEVDGVLMPMYNQREIDHMVDVRHLIDMLKSFILGLLLLLGVSIFVLLRKNEGFSTLFLGQFVSTILVFLCFIGMALTDFNMYFIKFHELFFTNDLWLLNPLTDRMIMLLPEVFFRDIVIVIVSFYAFVSLFLAVIGSIYDKKRQVVK